MAFLVPIYSACSSVGNLQSLRSIQLPVMVCFSCLAYAANRVANVYISDRGDIVSAVGAFVIGICGNMYSRVVGGTAFTSMVTGVLFLVPVSACRLRNRVSFWDSDVRHGRSLPSGAAAASSSRTTAVPRSGIPAASSWASV